MPFRARSVLRSALDRHVCIFTTPGSACQCSVIVRNTRAQYRVYATNCNASGPLESRPEGNIRFKVNIMLVLTARSTSFQDLTTRSIHLQILSPTRTRTTMTRKLDFFEAVTCWRSVLGNAILALDNSDSVIRTATASSTSGCSRGGQSLQVSPSGIRTHDFNSSGLSIVAAGTSLWQKPLLRGI